MIDNLSVREWRCPLVTYIYSVCEWLRESAGDLRASVSDCRCPLVIYMCTVSDGVRWWLRVSVCDWRCLLLTLSVYTVSHQWTPLVTHIHHKSPADTFILSHTLHLQWLTHTLSYQRSSSVTHIHSKSLADTPSHSRTLLNYQRTPMVTHRHFNSSADTVSH